MEWKRILFDRYSNMADYFLSASRRISKKRHERVDGL